MSDGQRASANDFVIATAYQVLEMYSFSTWIFNRIVVTATNPQVLRQQ